MSEGPKNFIITLTGPSGCGKSYVIERIMDLEQKFALQKMVYPIHCNLFHVGGMVPTK